MKFCLIGKKLSHSYSETLHRSYGLDYKLFEVAPDELEDFATNCEYDGYNVTIPYKKEIMRYLDSVSPLAERVGAVNTVVNRNGKKCGYNTDYHGFLGALRYAGVSVKDKNVLVLGSGGASNVALVALKDAGAKTITVVSRSGEINYENCYELSDTEIIVNATPVGTFPEIEAAPIDIAKFKKLDFLFDLIYNPIKTALIKKAERLGIGRLNGLCMLVIQALKAREIWLGTPFDDADVEKCLKALKEKTVNIALCGMPSSGKSTVGRLISEKLKKEFYDTDEVIYEMTGRTPEQIILNDGEKAFRDVEEKAVASVCAKRGVVIALGGGAVLRERNRSFLDSTAFTVWLKRDLKLLDDTDRPTLKGAGAENLYKMRASVYDEVSDFSVSNDNLAEDTAKEIIKAYEDIGY